MRIGTAGWSITRETAESFPGDGQHLQRYARVLRCAEINSSFYRSHRVETYERWAAQTPGDFRFAVKVPRAITHDARLRAAREPLKRFTAEIAGLGDKLGVVLVQLPPSFAFEARPVGTFFRLLRERFDGAVVCEPRHASWFTPAADRPLVALRVSRAAADPARLPAAADPGGWLGPDGDGRGATPYYRWHGSPRMYWSRYAPDWLRGRAAALQKWPAQADAWCIFDNTASGSAIVNALELQALLRAE
jgi:uncharacterized protein YecE (DUF72 family)